MIQIDIEMPKSCADCPLCHCKGKDDPWNYYCSITMDDINIEEWDNIRYNTCPLKEVPTESLTEPCRDTISRQEAIRIAEQGQVQGYEWQFKELVKLPSVTPQPKTGRWIIIDDCELFMAKCSECGEVVDSRMISKYPYCHCGAKMVES